VSVTPSLPHERPIELSEHLASGVVMYVATRDRSLFPESMFAMGARIDCERGVVTVFLPRATAASTLANLEDNGQIAVALTRPSDHKSFQIKGRSLAVREGAAADRDLQSVHRAALTEQFASVGVPRCLTRRIGWWPSVAVDIELHEIFAQTPGPRAGERVAGGG
jgi:hypothetical protein